MIRRFLRVSLATLALVLAISGSINLNRVGAQIDPVDSGGGGEGAGLCQYCGCNGGDVKCCTDSPPNPVTCWKT